MTDQPTSLDLRADEFAYHALVVARIRNEMQREGVQQKQLAGLIGRSQSFVSELLRGQQGLDVGTALLVDSVLRQFGEVPVTAPPSTRNGYDEALIEYAREAYLEFRRTNSDGRPSLKEVIDRFEVAYKADLR